METEPQSTAAGASPAVSSPWHLEPPPKPKQALAHGSWIRLCDGIQSVNSCAIAFNAAGSMGLDADAADQLRQDQLRAMVVIAGATIDITIKQLIVHCLTSILRRSEDAAENYQNRVRSMLAKDLKSGTPELLTRALMDQAPREVLREEAINSLIGSSLQSVGQINNAASLLGINQRMKVPKVVRDALRARQQIVHELDAFADPHAPDRRRTRTGQQTFAEVMALIDIAAAFCKHVDDVLSLPERA